ncbi:hypothetical protein D043_4297A, partial [Vibrio parahaemolyticus EKP-021]
MRAASSSSVTSITIEVSSS